MDMEEGAISYQLSAGVLRAAVRDGLKLRGGRLGGRELMAFIC
jgi:hypothetical protein